MKFQVFAIVLCFGLASAVVRPGVCPDVQVHTNFNLPEYMGIWYEIQRYNHDFQITLDCITSEYDLPDVNVDLIDMVNRGVLLGDPIQAFTSIGVGVRTYPDDPNMPAKLSTGFFGQEPNQSNYWVLGTDYTSYALVWHCEDIGDGNVRELAWALSRNKIPGADYWTNINRLIESNNIDPSEFRITEQREEICLPGVGPIYV